MRPRHGHQPSPAACALPLLLLTAPAPVTAQASAGACTIREIERWPARLDDGSHVYVEPTDLTTWNGRSLLAGTPTYVIAPGQVGPDADNAMNSIAGVMLGPGRRTTVVPWPVDRENLRVLRSAVRPEGGWLMIVGEMDGAVRLPSVTSLIGLWYGEWNGETWTRVEAVPMPPRAGVKFVNTSSVAWIADGFAWALPFANDTDRGAIVLKRLETAWSWEVITATHGLYVELWAQRDTLFAALVHPDRTRSHDTNSVFLYVGSPEWKQARRLVLGGRNDVHRPRAVRSHGRTVLSWIRRDDLDWEAQALLDVMSLDSSTTTFDPMMSAFAVRSHGDERAFWTTSHVVGDSIESLRFFVDDDRTIVPVGRVAMPYTGFFALDTVGDREVLVAGPRFSPDQSAITLITLALRLAYDCPDR